MRYSVWYSVWYYHAVIPDPVYTARLDHPKWLYGARASTAAIRPTTCPPGWRRSRPEDDSIWELIRVYIWEATFEGFHWRGFPFDSLHSRPFESSFKSFDCFDSRVSLKLFQFKSQISRFPNYLLAGTIKWPFDVFVVCRKWCGDQPCSILHLSNVDGHHIMLSSMVFQCSALQSTEFNILIATVDHRH